MKVLSNLRVALVLLSTSFVVSGCGMQTLNTSQPSEKATGFNILSEKHEDHPQVIRIISSTKPTSDRKESPRPVISPIPSNNPEPRHETPSPKPPVTPTNKPTSDRKESPRHVISPAPSNAPEPRHETSSPKPPVTPTSDRINTSGRV